MKATRPWFTIKAAENEAEVLIYDQIGKDWFGDGIGAEDFVKALDAIEAETIHVRLNSPGGLVFEGLAIFNALERHRARIVTHVDGIAASIASIVALAGDEVRIAENAFLMVHRAWGVTIGNRNDMLEMGATLEKLDGSLAATYARKSGKPLETITGWMDAETWFTAKEAKDAGLVDVIGGKRDVKNAVDLSRFARVPTSLAARMAALRDTPRAVEPPPAVVAPDITRLAAASVRTLARVADL